MNPIKRLRKFWRTYKKHNIHKVKAKHVSHDLTKLTKTTPVFLNQNGPIVIFRCHNEELRLPYFLDYYRQLGFSGFIAIYNESTDNTKSILLASEDILCYEAPEKNYREDSINWINHLLWKYIKKRWVLLADVDELLVYPGIERSGISGLIHKAEVTNSKIIYTPLIDMYSNRPIRETNYTAKNDFISTCPWFDNPDLYQLKSNKHGINLRGGIRRRIFFNDSEPSPLLSKYSFIYWTHNNFFVNPHRVEPMKKQPLITAPLLHFKFFQDFHSKTENAINEGNYWNDSIEYKAYYSAINNNPRLSLQDEYSIEYKSSSSIQGIIDKINAL